MYIYMIANDCFFLCKETCVYAKITAVICFENVFRTCSNMTCSS